MCSSIVQRPFPCSHLTESLAYPYAFFKALGIRSNCEQRGKTRASQSTSKAVKVTVDARQQLRADLKLAIAGVSESVVVNDTVALVNTATFGKITSVQPAENSGNRTGQLALRMDF